MSTVKAPWAGIVKLQEEMAELSVELAKLHAYPSGDHPDSLDGHPPLLLRMVKELGDVQAAINFFVEVNGIDRKVINDRRVSKEKQYWEWHHNEGMTGTKAVK